MIPYVNKVKYLGVWRWILNLDEKSIDYVLLKKENAKIQCTNDEKQNIMNFLLQRIRSINKYILLKKICKILGSTFFFILIMFLEMFAIFLIHRNEFMFYIFQNNLLRLLEKLFRIILTVYLIKGVIKFVRHLIVYNIRSKKTQN